MQSDIIWQNLRYSLSEKLIRRLITLLVTLLLLAVNFLVRAALLCSVIR